MTLLWIYFLALAAASPAVVYHDLGVRGPASTTCSQIANQISSKSAVYYPLTISPNYQNGIKHYMTSSKQDAACVVEVGSNQDTAVVIKIVGSRRTPFAIKSGGHASNPGFSSTTGVQISLTRLKAIQFSADKSTVSIGLGNLWSDVYKALDGTGYNVVGGRVSGPGTGGFTLGGGYSWFTNQYGLTCDTVKSFTLVLPDGTISEITSAKPDLFFALKGGLNRFGIVTSIVYKTIPQAPKIYGGYQLYGPDAVPALLKATLDFQNENTDPKAQTILTLNSIAGVPGAILLLYNDGAASPAAFSAYNEVMPLISDVSSRSFLSFSQSTPSELGGGIRGAFHSIVTSGFTQKFLDAVYNETLFYGSLSALHTGVLISYDVEPFGDYGIYATDSAYPHSSSQLPLNLYFTWLSPLEDGYWRSKMAQSAVYLTEVARKEGILPVDNFIYPNYALAHLTGDQLYGPTNAARLRNIRNLVDPTRVMELCGGFIL